MIPATLPHVFVCLLGLIVLVAGCAPDRAENELPDTDEIPGFQVDAFWPQTLPDNWILGQVSGLSVDSRDHIWIFQRPGSLTAEEAGAGQDPPVSRCCVPAPPVIEFAPDGSVVQAWGGPGEGYEWVDSPHGIYVDHQDNVWVGDNGGSHRVLKFTRDGEFLLQIGEAGRTGGSNHTGLLGRPADMAVAPEDNEIYIADGYGNRRVVVFDAETGVYRRHWGAYGEQPHDESLDSYRPGAEPAPQFRGPVHGIALSGDGLVYVTDRGSNRVQVFQKDGSFVDEVVVRAETLSIGSTWDVALSEDPEQRWLYVADGANNVVWILERSTLELQGHFGHGGKNAGYFGWLHNIDVDSSGNIFTSEVEEGKRVQKFTRGSR